MSERVREESMSHAEDPGFFSRGTGLVRDNRSALAAVARSEGLFADDALDPVQEEKLGEVQRRVVTLRLLEVQARARVANLLGTIPAASP